MGAGRAGQVRLLRGPPPGEQLRPVRRYVEDLRHDLPLSWSGSIFSELLFNCWLGVRDDACCARVFTDWQLERIVDIGLNGARNLAGLDTISLSLGEILYCV